MHDNPFILRTGRDFHEPFILSWYVCRKADVETAAFQVGTESSAQFSREYSRMFGMPPRRDVAALRGVAA